MNAMRDASCLSRSDAGVLGAPPALMDGEELARGPRMPTAERIDALGEMAGVIAHDFRNVLAIIGSALNLAERYAGDAQKAAPYLAAARESVERGARLTSRLVALARSPGLDIELLFPAPPRSGGNGEDSSRTRGRRS